MTAFTSSESKFDEARGFGANETVTSEDSAAIKLAYTFHLLISTVNVKLDWDAMLDFASRHNATPQNEHFPMSNINEAFGPACSGQGALPHRAGRGCLIGLAIGLVLVPRGSRG